MSGSIINPARYLLIRLCFQKQDKSHHFDQLTYQHLNGDESNIERKLVRHLNFTSCYECFHILTEITTLDNTQLKKCLITKISMDG